LSPRRRTLRRAEAVLLNAEADELKKAIERRAQMGLVRCYTRRLADDRFSGTARACAAESLARLDEALTRCRGA
jgi:hypothetical protein